MPKGMDMMVAMLGKPKAKESDGYGADSVRQEADMAAKEFVRNPTAETFRAAKQLCEELEEMEGGYGEEEEEVPLTKE